MLSNTHFSMAVHVLSALAYSNEKLLASEDLARDDWDQPVVFAWSDWAAAGSRIGGNAPRKGGGTTLGRPAAKITLHDVYRATESEPALKVHVCDGKSPCPVARGMDRMLSDVNGRLEKVLEKELKRVTVADLVASYVD